MHRRLRGREITRRTAGLHHVPAGEGVDRDPTGHIDRLQQVAGGEVPGVRRGPTGHVGDRKGEERGAVDDDRRHRPTQTRIGDSSERALNLERTRTACRTGSRRSIGGPLHPTVGCIVDLNPELGVVGRHYTRRRRCGHQRRTRAGDAPCGVIGHFGHLSTVTTGLGEIDQSTDAGATGRVDVHERARGAVPELHPAQHPLRGGHETTDRRQT